MIRLLGRKTSGNVQKVIFLLEELGLEYRREDYGRQFNNTGGDYLKLNPNAKVPTLIDDDTVVWESNSVLRYLARRNGNRFYSADPASQSKIEPWMDWQLASLDAAFLPIFRDLREPPEKRSAQFAVNLAQLGQTLEVLERGLGAAKWVAGEAMTIADICLAPVADRCMKFPVELPAVPAVRRWHAEITKRSAFQRAIA